MSDQILYPTDMTILDRVLAQVASFDDEETSAHLAAELVELWSSGLTDEGQLVEALRTLRSAQHLGGDG